MNFVMAMIVFGLMLGLIGLYLWDTRASAPEVPYDKWDGR